MTREMVKAATDEELGRVIAWAQGQQKARADLRKQETIARIREMARSIDLSIKIEGMRGRPPKTRRVGAASTKA